MPATVKPGVWPGLLGIWKRALEPPAMKLTRVLSSMMPVTLASPCHWSVSSWIGVYGRRRVLDADAVVQELADGEIVDRAGAAAILKGRLHPVVRAARDRGLGAGIGRARLERDVDDAGRAEAVLRRQRAGDQRQLWANRGVRALAEQRQAFGQLHAVEPVLQVAVVAADMDLAEAVLHHAGRAQQHLVERRILALRDGLDGGAAEVVARWRRGWAGSSCAPRRAGWP